MDRFPALIVHCILFTPPPSTHTHASIALVFFLQSNLRLYLHSNPNLDALVSSNAIRVYITALCCRAGLKLKRTSTLMMAREEERKRFRSLEEQASGEKSQLARCHQLHSDAMSEVGQEHKRLCALDKSRLTPCTPLQIGRSAPAR